MSGQRQEQSPAFILHRRSYGESSYIVTCFTREHGRMSMLCKGCRKPGKASKILEPFRRYNLSWYGRTELKTLTHADEYQVLAIHREQRKLYCGLYLNELLSALTKVTESDAHLFDLYEMTLKNLLAGQGGSIKPTLRYFELKLIQFMGYGVSLEHERDGVTPISPELAYGFQLEHGFFKITGERDFVARGDSIIAFNKGQLENGRQEREIRTLTRILLNHYLPDAGIQSRKLFLS